MRNLMSDLANLLHPLPRAGEVEPAEALDDACAEAEQRQRDWLDNWEARVDAEGDDVDPLLAELREARRRIRESEQWVRLLIAYGRDFARPRAYPYEDLARASGYSVSGTRTAYGTDEVAEVMRRTGARPRAMGDGSIPAVAPVGVPGGE
jgi:hypothetical protein